MNIIYELGKKDYINFNLYNTFIKDRNSYISTLLFFLAVEAIGSPNNLLLKVLLSCTAYTVALIGLIYFNANRLYKNDIDFFGCYAVSIKEEGFVVTNNNGEHRINWEGIRDVIYSKKEIYIYCGANTYYIIPENAFKDDKDLREEFIMELGYHKYIKKVSPRTA